MTGRLALRMLTARRTLCLVGVMMAVATTAGLAASSAEAAPYLDRGEARQALGRALHRNFEYGVVTGTLRARCYRARRNLIRCYIAFVDRDRDVWCGTASVRETYTSYRSRWNVDLC
jgi:hypothetical protein